jgi:DnaK suppressor protein
MEISVARKRLEEMRADLERTVSVLQGEHHLLRGGGAEQGDAGQNLTEADRNAAAVQAAQAHRTEVLAAIARIDDGSYGNCVDCGNPVPEPRLEARPTTARCVPCQAKRDRRRLRGGAPVRHRPHGYDLGHRAGTPRFLLRLPGREATGGPSPPAPAGAGGSSPRGKQSPCGSPRGFNTAGDKLRTYRVVAARPQFRVHQFVEP